MMKLKAHYEEKISSLNSVKPPQRNEVVEKIKALKSSLVGGENANNTQLKEKRKHKKIAAEQRLDEIANAINSVEQSEARDILQGHYTDIQHELKLKTDALKSISRKVINNDNNNQNRIQFCNLKITNCFPLKSIRHVLWNEKWTIFNPNFKWIERIIWIQLGSWRRI